MSLGPLEIGEGAGSIASRLAQGGAPAQRLGDDVGLAGAHGRGDDLVLEVQGEVSLALVQRC